MMRWWVGITGTKHSPKTPIYRTPTISISNLTDREGLDKAYAREGKTYLHGDTLYVAGTHYWHDVWDDANLAFHQTFEAQGYVDADAVLNANLQAGNLVAHSLGGSAILELQKNHQERQFNKNNLRSTSSFNYNTR